jgi:hypothetical protein
MAAGPDTLGLGGLLALGDAVTEPPSELGEDETMNEVFEAAKAHAQLLQGVVATLPGQSPAGLGAGQVNMAAAVAAAAAAMSGGGGGSGSAMPGAARTQLEVRSHQSCSPRHPPHFKHLHVGLMPSHDTASMIHLTLASGYRGGAAATGGVRCRRRRRWRRGGVSLTLGAGARHVRNRMSYPFFVTLSYLTSDDAASIFCPDATWRR